MKKLVYYTCYFGGENNYSRMIGPVPSHTDDCFYFTNNPGIFQELENTGWKRVWMDIPIYNCPIRDTESSKHLRCCPHEYEILLDYEYTCWVDSKMRVLDAEVKRVVSALDTSPQYCCALTKHPYSDRFTSVWDEFNLAITVPKYARQEAQYRAYIEKQIRAGYSDKICVHYCGGFQLRRNSSAIARKIGEEWLAHIRECGIEDQISFQFVKQAYEEMIMPLEYQETWKYSFE